MNNDIMKAMVAYFKAQHDQSNYINWDIPITVCSSGAGYYVGQIDPEDGAPLCRLSCEYWGTYQEAEDALNTGNFSAKLWL